VPMIEISMPFALTVDWGGVDNVVVLEQICPVDKLSPKRLTAGILFT